VLILKGVKVICFDTLLQVLILKEFAEEQFRRRCFSVTRRSWREERAGVGKACGKEIEAVEGNEADSDGLATIMA